MKEHGEQNCDCIHILICLHKVSLLCLSIDGLFYISFTIKTILQIKHHTHNFFFYCFDQITNNFFCYNHLNPKLVSIYQVQNNMMSKMVSGFIFICFHKFNLFRVSFFHFSIGWLFYIIFIVKIILQIERHNHHFVFFAFQ